MSVAKMGFLVDRLNKDCSPLQFLRELTKNSVESIERAEGSGEIRWDVDWNRADLLGPESAQKLCIVDTGIGMSGKEMVGLILELRDQRSQRSLLEENLRYTFDGDAIIGAPRGHSAFVLRKAILLQ